MVKRRETKTNCIDCGAERILILEESGDIIFKQEQTEGLICMRCEFIMFKMIEFHKMTDQERDQELRRMVRSKFERDHK